MDNHKLIPIWDIRYSIDNQKIDSQHQKLFELAAKVENAVYKFVKRDELKEILIELFNYMKEHFSYEENYMREIHYPHFFTHKQMHKKIIHDMSNLIQNIKTTNDLKEKLYTIMSDWLLNHILRQDVMIGKWANEHLKKENQTEETKIKEVEVSEDLMEFIYSCSCQTQHRLTYEEHNDVLQHNKILKCKKCQKPLFFVKSEEKTYKG